MNEDKERGGADDAEMGTGITKEGEGKLEAVERTEGWEAGTVRGREEGGGRKDEEAGEARGWETSGDTRVDKEGSREGRGAGKGGGGWEGGGRDWVVGEGR